MYRDTFNVTIHLIRYRHTKNDQKWVYILYRPEDQSGNSTSHSGAGLGSFTLHDPGVRSPFYYVPFPTERDTVFSGMDPVHMGDVVFREQYTSVHLPVF